MQRRWTLLGLVLGVLACFDTQPPSSCDYKPTGAPLWSWGFGDAGARDTCTAAGGSCLYSEHCPQREYADTTHWCAGDGFTCCVPDLPPDASPDGAADGGVEGLCNLVACAAGCTCEPAAGDAGGGACVCAEAGIDAGADVGADAEADAATDGPVDASQDVPAPNEAGDAAGLDSGGDEGGDGGASAACGVIQCASGCQCVDAQLSECVCP